MTKPTISDDVVEAACVAHFGDDFHARPAFKKGRMDKMRKTITAAILADSASDARVTDAIREKEEAEFHASEMNGACDQLELERDDAKEELAKANDRIRELEAIVAASDARVREEREACADIADERASECGVSFYADSKQAIAANQMALNIARAIRSRSTPKSED